MKEIAELWLRAIWIELPAIVVGLVLVLLLAYASLLVQQLRKQVCQLQNTQLLEQGDTRMEEFKRDYSRFRIAWDKFRWTRCPLCGKHKVGMSPHLKCARREQFLADRPF